MRRMKRKDEFIDVIGTWNGTEDCDVIRWLTDNGYVHQIQVEDEQQIGWRNQVSPGDEYIGNPQPRTQLCILGKRMYDETTLVTGQVVTLASGRICAFDQDSLDGAFVDI